MSQQLGQSKQQIELLKLDGSKGIYLQVYTSSKRGKRAIFSGIRMNGGIEHVTFCSITPDLITFRDSRDLKFPILAQFLLPSTYSRENQSFKNIEKMCNLVSLGQYYCSHVLVSMQLAALIVTLSNWQLGQTL